MIGFILAAGEGSRLRPYTAHVPKPMIDVFGRPILEYNVRAMVRAGIERIIINTHFHADVIRAHFGDGRAFGAEITYSHESALRGTSGALVPMRDELDRTMLVVYGDNLTDCPLAAIVARHREAAALATLALYERDDVLASGIVGIDDRDRVTRFLEKPQPADVFSHWVNAGILVAEPAIFDFIPATGPSDFGRDVLPAILAAGGHIAAYRMRDHLWWIDSIRDYERTLADPALAAFARTERTLV